MNHHTTTPSRARRILLSVLCYLLILALMGGVWVVLTSACVQAAVEHRVTTAADLRAQYPDGLPFDCILVLGAGLKADGTPSDMLSDRVAVACGLYDPNHPIPVIMSGDHSDSYNEVAAMKQLAVSLGVDSSDVFLDHEGYSTYESIYRMRETFGARRVLIVTQEYHLYRALFIARELGLEAYGVPADLRAYRKETWRELREMLARCKDMFQAGRGEAAGDVDAWVDLGGDGDLT